METIGIYYLGTKTLRVMGIGLIFPLGFLSRNFPKGPCTHIVDTLTLKYSLYKYIGPKVSTIWVQGPDN